MQNLGRTPVVRAGQTSSDLSIAELPSGVNAQYTQEGGEYSIGTGEDFETQMSRLVEQYGRHDRGMAPERDVAIPKSITGMDRVSLTARTVTASTTRPSSTYSSTSTASRTPSHPARPCASRNKGEKTKKNTHACSSESARVS